MPFPLPDCVYAADLEIYIRDERDLGTSKIIQGHYYYKHPSQEDEGERIDPLTLVRPTAPLFGRYIDGEDHKEYEPVECSDSGVPSDEKGASGGDFWMEDISITDEEDFKNLFSFQVPSQEGACHTVQISPEEESDSEDGAGESLYEKVFFGRNRVQMSFLAYKQEWEEGYDYISQGMSGMFYFPYPRPQPQRQWKPKYQSQRKNSRLHDLVQELKKTTEDSRSQPEESLAPSRRTNKLAPPPLRVRLLSATFQNRAMAAGAALFQQQYSSGASSPPKCCTGGKESIESLGSWELKAIESLYELEKV